MKIDLREIPILYMNMDDEPRRDRNMKILFNDLIEDLDFKKENIHRIPGTNRNPIKPAGVAEAHLSAIQFAKQFSGPVLILEDDLEIADFTDPVLEVPGDSDAVYLGTMQFGLDFSDAYAIVPEMPYDGITVNVEPIEYPNSPDLYRVISMTGGQSILYVTETYKRLLENSCKLSIRDGIAHDTYLATVQRLANVYCYNKPKFINKSCRWDSTFMLEQAFYDRGSPFQN
jgi:hypothetical protein